MENAASLNFDASNAMPWFSAALLAVGLAASSGLRTFLPLLLLSGAGKFSLFGVELSGAFAWLATDTAFITLILATIFELAADKVPFVDHGLDAAGTFLRPIAGALVAAAVWNHNDPATAALLGIIVGAPLALGMHTAKAGTRAGSTASTAGIGNPVLSFFEDFIALLLGGAALLAPWLVPLLLLIAFLLVWQVFRVARGLGGASR